MGSIKIWGLNSSSNEGGASVPQAALQLVPPTRAAQAPPPRIHTAPAPTRPGILAPDFGGT
ncbi:MAG TPA: hypothetical protein VF844_07005 [Ktedonobacteraceae bacterium]